MKKYSAIFMSLLLILASGCSKESSLQIKLSAPKTFTPGKTYPIQIQIADTQGHPVEGAKVAVNLNMKNMDHGQIPIKTEELGEGKYLGLAEISMNGDWVADINVTYKGNTVEEEKDFTVEALTKENAHKVTKYVALPDFKLIDQNGSKVTNETLKGKTVALTFTYVNCADPNACPVLLSNFSNLQQDLKAKKLPTDKLLLLSVSIDPQNDTPEILKEHAQKMNFDTTYLKMLTGDLNEIKKITDTLGEHFEKNGSVISHDNKTFIFNGEGVLTHEFTGSYIDRDELLQVITKQ
jgi:cytochrome oxidase Cu insertion factor (SCO1/SenC/PrrC family)